MLRDLSLRPHLDLKDLSVMLFRTVFMRSSRDLFHVILAYARSARQALALAGSSSPDLVTFNARRPSRSALLLPFVEPRLYWNIALGSVAQYLKLKVLSQGTCTSTDEGLVETGLTT